MPRAATFVSADKLFQALSLRVAGEVNSGSAAAKVLTIKAASPHLHIGAAKAT
jgi:hypothetical protein